MASGEELTFTSFSVELMERQHDRMKQAVDGLTDEQLWYQPAQESNPVGWLVWHLSRFKDIQTSRVAGEAEIWVSDGWAGRFGLPEERHGNGDTPEQVATFRADRELLFGYVEAAHRATVDRVAAMTDEDLAKQYQYASTQEPRPAWRGLLGVVMDFTQHTGQIGYLRGLITGFGWRG